MTAEYNFKINQGASLVKPFVWKDKNGVPVDLTGYLVRMQVRQSVSSDEVLFEATTGNGRFFLGPNPGMFVLSLPAEETSQIEWRRGKYDIELVSSSGFVTRLLYGVIEVSREVTR